MYKIYITIFTHGTTKFKYWNGSEFILGTHEIAKLIKENELAETLKTVFTKTTEIHLKKL